jgi:hypothetical protein
MRVAFEGLKWCRALVGWAVVLVSARASAATQVLAPSDDTFINQGHPANNNGATLSIFTGTDGQNGVMRGLIRFGMPAALSGRVTVTSAQLTMTLQALGDMTAGTGAVESLQALTQAWAEGNGIGNVVMSFTVGQLCGGAITGATWTEPNCAVADTWTTAGGTVVAAVSGQSDTTGLPVGAQVVWSSTANALLAQDVQGWIDDPASNDGWRITSATEGAGHQAQRFFSKEAGASAPALTVSYVCKTGFVASGNDCVAAAVPAVGPVAIAGLAGGLAALAFRVPSAWRRRRSPRPRRA